MIHYLPDNYPDRLRAIFSGLVGGLACSAMLLLAGCQTYQPEALARAVHKEEFKSRQASSESVKKFAKRLGETTSYNQAFDASNGLSLGEGETVALVFNPDLRVARLRAGVAEATAEYAGLWDDPTFSFNVLNIRSSVPDPWIIGSALSFTLPISGRLRVEKARAEAAKHAELERVAETEWKILRDVADGWLSWSAQKHQLQQTESILVALDSVVGSTSKLAREGELPKTEAALFTIERASREAERDRFRGAVAESEQKLRSMMGLSPSAPLKMISTLSAGRDVSNAKEPNEGNPTLTRLRSEYAVAEQTLLREIRKQYPDLTFGPQTQIEQGQSSIGFVSGIPIPILNANKGGIAEARAERKVARAIYETEYEKMVGRLAALHSRLDAINNRRTTINENLVPLVDRQVSDANRLLALGEGSSLVLLESLLRSSEAKLQLVSIQLDDALAKNEIRYLVGPDNRK